MKLSYANATRGNSLHTLEQITARVEVYMAHPMMGFGKQYFPNYGRVIHHSTGIPACPGADEGRKILPTLLEEGVVSEKDLLQYYQGDLTYAIFKGLMKAYDALYGAQWAVRERRSRHTPGYHRWK